MYARQDVYRSFSKSELVYIQIDLSDLLFFFFQAEDGIRDRDVTGVQTCALPISEGRERLVVIALLRKPLAAHGKRNGQILPLDLPRRDDPLAGIEPRLEIGLPLAAGRDIIAQQGAGDRLPKEQHKARNNTRQGHQDRQRSDGRDNNGAQHRQDAPASTGLVVRWLQRFIRRDHANPPIVRRTVARGGFTPAGKKPGHTDLFTQSCPSARNKQAPAAYLALSEGAARDCEARGKRPRLAPISGTRCRKRTCHAP